MLLLLMMTKMEQGGEEEAGEGKRGREERESLMIQMHSPRARDCTKYWYFIGTVSLNCPKDAVGLAVSHHSHSTAEKGSLEGS